MDEMSESQGTELDVQFVLPKKRPSTILPEEYPSKTTKTIGLQIEDFLEKLNEDLPQESEDFIMSPKFVIGDQEGFVGIYYELGTIRLTASRAGGHPVNLKSISVSGICGNLAFGKINGTPDFEYLSVELGFIEALREAMISSGNHKLDLQVTLTAVKIEANET